MSLPSGRLRLKNICGQFECGMLLVITAVKTKWLKTEDNKPPPRETDGVFSFNFQMLLCSSLLPYKDLISDHNLNVFHLTTASVCLLRAVFLGKGFGQKRKCCGALNLNVGGNGSVLATGG